jgi:hypothetical protein
MIFDDFFDWLESPDGEESLQVINDVQSALDGATVDLKERKIIWKDGQRLTIDESASKIKKDNDAGIDSIKNRIISWLEMDYVPEGLTEKESKTFEKRIDDWIRDYYKSGKGQIITHTAKIVL